MSIDISHIQSTKRRKLFNDENVSSQKVTSNIFYRKISDKKKAFIYKDLAILLKAGIDFKTSLTIIKDQQKNKKDKKLLEYLLENVVKGKPLYETMHMSENFSDYEVFSVKIGEETHMLGAILEELQKYFERKVKLRKQVLSILAYPAFIMILTFATLYFMLTYVVPLFESVFNQFNKELPKLTKTIIYFSENIDLYFIVFILVVLISMVFYYALRTKESFKNIKSKIILKLPFFGKLIREIYLARFCQAMALLMVSKTSLLEALSLVKQMINFYPVTKALEKVETDIYKGNSLGESLSKFKIFDNNMISMIKVAEQINQLDTMFLKLSKHYEEEVDYKTKIIGTIIEPVLILIIGGIVGIIMISMYAPMFDFSEILGN